jgi:type IV pilus assembly protein PilO
MTTSARFLGIELDRRGIAFLVGGGGLLVVALIAWQITLPAYTRIQELDTTIAQQKQDISTKQQQVAEKPGLLAQKQRSEQLLASTISLIPSQDKLPSLLIDVTSLAKSSNVDLRKFTPGEIKAMPELNGVANIQSTAAKVSLTGNFSDVLQMIGKIERLEEILRIENVTLKPIETKSLLPGAPTTQRLTVDFDLTAYIQGGKVTSPAPGAPPAPAPAAPANPPK